MSARLILTGLVLHAAAFGGLAADRPRDPDRSVLAPLIEVLGQVDDARFQLDVLTGIQVALEGRRQMAMPAAWPAVAEQLAKSPSAEVRRRARELSVLFGDPRALAALRQTLMDSDCPAAERQDALKALLQKHDRSLLPLLETLLDDRAMCGPAIRGLAAYENEKTPELILRRYASLAAAEKGDAIATLSSRVRYAMALVEAVEAGRVPRGDLSAFTVRQLVGLNHKPLSEKLEAVWGSIRATSEDRSALIAGYKKRLTADLLAKADRSHGRLVFAKTCASCHKLFDAGEEIGPELTGSQRSNLDYVLENLVDPNAVVGRDYQMTVIVTDGGRIINGIIRRENESAVTVQTANETVVVPKNEIEERKRSPVSLMPEGLLEKLTADELRDLVAYLAGPTQVPLPEGAPNDIRREEAKRSEAASQ